METSDFYSQQFNERLKNSYNEVRKIIDNEKYGDIVLLEKTNHQYTDKFFVAEQITRSMGNNVLLFLKTLGLKDHDIDRLILASNDEPILLNFTYSTSAKFLREIEKKEKLLETSTSYGFSKTTSTIKTLYLFELYFNYSINICIGASKQDTSKVISLSNFSKTIEFQYFSNVNPLPLILATPLETNLTWLFRNLKKIEGRYSFTFNINRSNPKCLTPYRNPDIEKINNEILNLSSFASKSFAQIKLQLSKINDASQSKFDFINLIKESTHALATLLPVLFKKHTPTNLPDLAEEDVVYIPSQDDIVSISEETPRATLFTEEQLILLENHLASSLNESIELGNKIIDKIGGDIRSFIFVSTLTHAFNESLFYIEELLRHQIIKAISRNLTTSDFNEYMNFHYRKIFNSKFAPNAFNYSIRRNENFSPEGYARIYVDNDSTKSLFAFTANLPEEVPMKFAISDNAQITFTGPKYVHGILFNSFSDETSHSLTLDLEARQFSSFIVLLGNMITSTQISIKHAIFLKNKDSLQIPLLLESISSQKQFLDYISSLSPEQQEFAQAYRQMQLETSLFGMVLIQVRPQLEKVLNLPPASLVKEIQLNDDLVTLFTKYQINSDLLAFEEEYQVPSNKDKIQAVKTNVDNINKIIKQSQAKAIDEADKSRKYQYGSDHSSIVFSKGMIQSQQFEGFCGGGGRGGRGGVLRTSSALHGFGASSCPPPPCPPPCPPSCSAPAPAPAPPSCVPVPRSQSFNNSMTLATKRSESLDLDFFSMAVDSSANLGTTSSKPNITTPEPNTNDSITSSSDSTGDNLLNLVSLPKKLDDVFYKYCPDENLRSTTIKVYPNKTWIKNSFESILSTKNQTFLDNNAQSSEKNAAFDLLDALTRSGGLTIDQGASFHLFVGFTHQFDETIMDTLVKKNVNPIIKVEKSAIIMQSVLHNLSFSQILKPQNSNQILKNIKLDIEN